MTLDVRRLGRVDYAEGLALQNDLVAARARDEIVDTLLLLEHPPVFTTGRGVTPEALPLGDEIPVVETSRGGDVTYHGPGQIVGYWIRKLDGAERDLHRHLRLVEEGLIHALATFGLTGVRVPDLTGVWIDGRKVASIGVAVRSWVTFHGFALNLDVAPDVYERFRPCGLDPAVMGALADFATPAPPREAVEAALEAAFYELTTP